MKIKDLLDFNPEAEIKIVMPTGLPYDGELDWGWSTGKYDGDDEDSLKSDATEVDIFLNQFNEK